MNLATCHEMTGKTATAWDEIKRLLQLTESMIEFRKDPARFTDRRFELRD